MRLAQYAAQVKPPLVILGIGSYQGCSDIILATYSSVSVYAIDFHSVGDGDDYPFGDDDRRNWTENVVKWEVADKVRPINLSSHDVAKIWKLPVGLAFVDGSHSESAVFKDIAGFYPFVIDDGIMAFHDIQAPQILRAIENWGALLSPIEVVDGTGFYRKNASAVK